MYQAALKALELIAPVNTGSTQTGADVDLKGYLNAGGREFTVIADIGTVNTAGTAAVKIQSGADTGSYADLDTTSFPATATTTGVTQWRVKTVNRYVRAIATLSGSGVSITFGVQALLDKEVE